MDMENKEFDNIELRSDKVRNIIGMVPPWLVRTGTAVISLVVVALAFVAYSVHYPITVEAQGEIKGKDSLEFLVPYKYIYLFKEPRNLLVCYEGRSDEDLPSVYSVASYDAKLLSIGGTNYFLAKAYVGSDSTRIQPGQKAEVRIVVSDRTLLEQVVWK